MTNTSWPDPKPAKSKPPRKWSPDSARNHAPPPRPLRAKRIKSILCNKPVLPDPPRLKNPGDLFLFSMDGDTS